MQPVGQLVTFITVAATMIFFRAPTMSSAIDLVKGVIGLNGFGLPYGVGAIAQAYGTDVLKNRRRGPPRFCSSRSSVPIRFKSWRRLNRRWA